jgi:hypothetical protein
MSLDVFLSVSGVNVEIVSPPRIFIRENGSTFEITRAEWDERFPGREPYTVNSSEREYCYEANITHNLGAMAQEAGIYKPIWHPEEVGITRAKQLIEHLEFGLTLLRADPERFEKFEPSNGWGTYKGLLRFVAQYLEACKENPDAEVEVSR